MPMTSMTIVVRSEEAGVGGNGDTSAERVAHGGMVD